jgi:hypothetical protein
MKSPVVIPGITNQYIPICKRKKYVRTSMEARHAHPS